MSHGCAGQVPWSLAMLHVAFDDDDDLHISDINVHPIPKPIPIPITNSCFLLHAAARIDAYVTEVEWLLPCCPCAISVSKINQLWNPDLPFSMVLLWTSIFSITKKERPCNPLMSACRWKEPFFQGSLKWKAKRTHGCVTDAKAKIHLHPLAIFAEFKGSWELSWETWESFCNYFMKFLLEFLKSSHSLNIFRKWRFAPLVSAGNSGSFLFLDEPISHDVIQGVSLKMH